ncbi:MAG: hypothetical protein ABI180_02520, partial [Microcoleus sp.]
LNAFWRLHKLPVWFRRFIKDSLFGAAQKLLDGLVRQDVLMIEEEQQAFLQNSERKSYELNRALGSVQKLMRSQAENRLELHKSFIDTETADIRQIDTDTTQIISR